MCYEEVRLMLDTVDVGSDNLYDRAYRLFVAILDRLTAGSTLLFAGTYSKLDFVARREALPNDLLRRLNTLQA